MAYLFRVFLLLSFLNIVCCIMNKKTRGNATQTEDLINDKNDYHARIQGGKSERFGTLIEKYPYNAYLYQYDRNVHPQVLRGCGGTIIGNKWILTAAHCRIEIDEMRVFMDFDKVLSGTLRRKVKNATLHPLFYQDRQYQNLPHYNLMILELENEITQGTHYAEAIPLSGEEDDIVDGVMGTLTGFGATFENESMESRLLHSVELPIVGLQKCKDMYELGAPSPGFFRGRQYLQSRVLHDKDVFCIGYKRGIKGMCQEDAGSPYVIGEGKYRRVVGIASHTVGCGSPRAPDIMTSVPFAREWICNVAGV